MTRIMRGTYRYIALGITFPLMSSSLWVVHKVDSGLLSGVSRHTQHICKAAVCQSPGDGADFFGPVRYYYHTPSI